MRTLVCFALLLAVSVGFAPRAAADSDVYYFTIAVGDTVYQDVPKEFTGIRVWVKNGRSASQPGLRVYRTVQRGWGRSPEVEKSPKSSAYFMMQRSGSQAVITGRWNEYPYLSGSGFTVLNYTAVPETVQVEVVR